MVVQKCLVVHDNKILALRRSETDVRRPLQWDLPGGWLDDDEDFIEGVKREIREEAQLEVTIPKLLYGTTKVRKDSEGNTIGMQRSCTFLFYKAASYTDKLQISDEHSEFKWMALEEAVNEFEYELHKEVLSYVLENDLLGE